MRLLIVDDEAPARTRLRRLLEEIGGHEIVGEAASGHEALRQHTLLAPDLLLLDIRMPGMDGLEVARHLAAAAQPPAVIFTTAYDEHALAAFDAQAVAYLLKPIRRERLEGALAQARRMTRAQLAAVEEPASARTHLCARVRGNLQLVPIEDVIYLQADQKYVSVCHPEGEVLIEESLKQLEEEFGERFVRVHRNALVAVACIEGLNRNPDGGSCVRLRGTTACIEVSRRHLPDLRRLLKDARL